MTFSDPRAQHTGECALKLRPVLGISHGGLLSLLKSSLPWLPLLEHERKFPAGEP